MDPDTAQLFSQLMGQAQVQGGATGNLYNNNPQQGAKVYMGGAYSNAHTTYNLSGMNSGTATAGAKVIGLDEATNDFWQWSEDEQRSLGQQLHRAGILSDPNDLNGIYSVWGKAVSTAANAYTFGKKKLTPWQVISMNLGLANGGKSKTSTSTATEVLLPNKEDAAAMVKSVFQNALGRDPDDDEKDRYQRMIMAQYRANPSTRTTTTTTGLNGSSSRVTEHEGLSATGAQSFLQDEAKADPEWGAYQAATTYMQALEQAIGAPG